VGRRVKKKKKKWKKEGKLKEEKKRKKMEKRKKRKEKKERGVLWTFQLLHSQEKLFYQTFLQNGFNSLAESAPPAQPQPEPEPEPYQTDPKHGIAYVHLFTTKKSNTTLDT
jgi:hypothetical protein